MSKDKPEIFDIWYSKEFKLKLIVSFSKYGTYWGIWETGQSFSCWCPEDFTNLIYIGKAKHNIEDLFKTENE